MNKRTKKNKQTKWKGLDILTVFSRKSEQLTNPFFLGGGGGQEHHAIGQAY